MTTTSTSSVVSRQNATTGRYWACCKASCSWPGKASVTAPARSCQADGVTAIDPNAVSSCDWGPSYMCFNQQPWNVSGSLSYGYVGAYITVRHWNRFSLTNRFFPFAALGSKRIPMVLCMLLSDIHLGSGSRQRNDRASDQYGLHQQ